MESVNDLDSKQQALKPIRTKIAAGEEESGKKPYDIEEEEEEPLSPAARIFHEPNFNVYIIAIMGWKTKMDLQVVKAQFPRTLLKHPRFSSLQVKDDDKGGAMRWVRTKVDLDKHIIMPDLDQKTESADKLVEDYISDLSKTSMDLSKPLWEFHILNIKTSDAESLGVFRIHHSLGDGVSLMSLVLACTRQVSDSEALPTLPVQKSSNPNPVKSGGVWSLIKMVWYTFVDVLMFIATALFLKDTVTPLTRHRKKGVGSESRRFAYRTVSFDDIKLVKNAMNTTINDVVMGVSLAGLSQYLNRRYGEAKGEAIATQKKNNIPENIRLRATLLVNIRPSPGIHAAAFLFHRVPNHTTLCFSNIVGPIEEIGFYGHPLAFIAPSCYGQPHGLMVHFQSYTNKMTFILSVDEATIPDPHQLCDDIEESLKLMKDAVIARGIVKENLIK
ncbi:O-acyltransferase WSD1-like isoform X2 [Vitis riparia]|uniref:O-acyltransferase WSD1-like isoform X2 n=1 Tax=Vitis riparia TaxID=96939 RepID=UPI00155AF75A|nr:O-acyltransferase WSD1-like isoform X2 [Vitis riparia]